MFFIIRAGLGYNPVIVESAPVRGEKISTANEYFELSTLKDSKKELRASDWKPGEFNHIGHREAQLAFCGHADGWGFAEFTNEPFSTIEDVLAYVTQMQRLYELSQEEFLFRATVANVEAKLFFFEPARTADEVNATIGAFDIDRPWQPAGCTMLAYFGKIACERFADIEICGKPSGISTYAIRHNQHSSSSVISFNSEGDSWGGPNMMILAVREPVKD